MTASKINTSAVRMFVLVVVMGTVCAAADQKASYPSMAPLDQYLMPDRNAEIALARSAAPPAISGEATVLVLGRHGYETAVEGKNGFVCVVERSWMSPISSADFWNPKLRGPVCFNPPAARSILPVTYKRTEWALAGQSKDQIIAANKTAYDKKELPALEPGAMSYMMSKQAYLTAHGGNLAHVMVYTPHGNPADWGDGIPNAPLALNPQFKDAEPIDVWVIAVGSWSDGSAAPAM